MTLTNHTDGKILYWKAEDRHRIPIDVADRAVVDPVIDKYRAPYDMLPDSAWEAMPDDIPLPLLAECATCNGSGNAHYELHDCDVCGGKGWLYSQIQDRRHNCPACVLDDYAWAGVDGKIALPKPGGEHVCPDCDGWGNLRGESFEYGFHYALAGLVVNPRYALRLLEPGAQFAAVDLPGNKIAVAFRTPSATGILMAIHAPRQPDLHTAARKWGPLPVDAWEVAVP